MPEVDASGRGAGRGGERGAGKPAILAVVLALTAVMIAVSVRMYKSTPSFSISQLRKAFANNDPDRVMQYFDVDAVVDHFLRNANAQDPEVAAFSAAMKEKLREGLREASGSTVEKNQIRSELAGSMAVDPEVDRKGVGVARVNFPGKPFSLLMKSNVGDKRWRVVGIEGADVEKWIRILGLNAPAGVLASLPPFERREPLR